MCISVFITTVILNKSNRITKRDSSQISTTGSNFDPMNQKHQIMNKRILSVLTIATMFILTGCYYDDDGGIFNCVNGSGPVETETLNLESFTGIRLDCSADVFITQGPEQEVFVKGQENIIDELELHVDDGVWEIDFDDCVRDYEELEIFITIPEIDYIRISGSGQVVGENTFTGEDIVLRISGSGDMDLGLDYDEIDAKISGSGEMEMEGFCDYFDFIISGSGDISAFDLEAQKGYVKISGSGRAEVTVLDVLDVDISGSGDVYYKGNPILNVDITGSGEVKDAN